MPLNKTLPEFLAVLRELLIDDLAGAIQRLLEALPENSGIHAAVLALLGSLRDTEKQRLHGTITNEDLQLQYNKIRSAFIDLLSRLTEADFAAPPAEASTAAKADAGTLLYNIPDTMPLQEETRCVVRIAVDKAVLTEGLPADAEPTFRGLHRISELMQVEVLDPSANGVFAVRTLSSPEQLVEKVGFTEWIFFVTPQKPGKHPLVVKVSVIELLHGQERKKELVLEEMVEIVASPAQPVADNFKSTGHRLAFHVPVVEKSEEEALWDDEDVAEAEPKSAQPPSQEPEWPPVYPEAPAPPTHSPKQVKRRFPLVWIAVLLVIAGLWYFSDDIVALFAGKNGPAEMAKTIVNSDAEAPVKLQKLDSLLATVAEDSIAKRKVADYRDTLDHRYWAETAAKSKTKTAARKYLELFPQGKHASEAKTIVRAGAKKETTPEPLPDSTAASPGDTTAVSSPEPPAPEGAVAGPKVPGMVLLPGGTIEMGDSWGRGLANEKPVHGVRVAPFYLGAYEVTFDEYDQFCKASGRLQPSDNGWGRGDMPVLNVAWYDAVAYCNWLSKQQRLKPVYTIEGFDVTADWTANGYRLPLESEWEYAARGGRKGQPWQFSGSGNADDVAWYRTTAGDKPRPVGLKRANGLGLYDMSGNVAEWCWNWMAPYPNANEKAAELAEGASEFLKVYRGGSFSSQGFRVRVSSREAASPSSRLDQVGFRVARNAGK